jgi:4-oxalocrotonate tautomerase
MPYIEVKVAGQLSREQKEVIVSEITDTMKRVAGKLESATYVVITEVPRDCWAKSGQLLD